MKQKKPKPWYRLRNVCLAFMFAIFIFSGWAFLEVWLLYNAEPSPTIDYRAKLRELAEEQADVSSLQANSSWSLLMEAVDLYRDAEDEVNRELQSESEFTL